MEENTPKDDVSQKTIRTYESDIAEAIEHRKTSQVSMLNAEHAHQREAAQPTATEGVVVGNVAEAQEARGSSIGKNILKILISIILIGGGGLGGYYLYSISPLAIKATTTTTSTNQTLTPAIIVPDAQNTINVTDESASTIIGQIKTASLSKLSSQQVLELIFYKEALAAGNDASQKGTATRITSTDFISDIGLTPPNMLTRSLTDSWMFGIYKGAQPAPFIILKTSFFQNTFAGMLQWESTMPDDLQNLFGIDRSAYQPQTAPVAPAAATSTSSTTFKVSSSTMASSSMKTATSSASSTIVASSTMADPVMTPPSSFFGIRGNFLDKVISNKDVREFKDINGKILFVYSFIDNSTLVIAQTEDALGEVISRFEKSAYVR